MINNRKPVILAARKLRLKGLSHRQIGKVLNISSSTVFLFTKNIHLSHDQHVKLKKSVGIFSYSKEIKAKWSSVGSKNWQAHIKHTRETLIQKIRDFFTSHNRIPFKREFYCTWTAYRRVFGSWNQAIVEAGYTPNPERFTHKFIARDGHLCDSLSEKIIDDWLTYKKIVHDKSVYYPGQNKFKTDFLINNKYWVEFLGLRGQLRRYDQLYTQKQELARKKGIHIIEIYPGDLFPQNILAKRFSFLL